MLKMSSKENCRKVIVDLIMKELHSSKTKSIKEGHMIPSLFLKLRVRYLIVRSLFNVMVIQY